jgi:hypothetical protein
LFLDGFLLLGFRICDSRRDGFGISFELFVPQDESFRIVAEIGRLMKCMVFGIQANIE